MSDPNFVDAPVHFRLARYPDRDQWPEDLDARGRPFVHVAKDIVRYGNMITAGSDTFRTYCGQLIYQADLARFAGAFKVTCPGCRKHAYG